MNYQSIAEIYAANDEIREKIKTTVEKLSAEELEYRADSQSWTIREIVEHIAIVENGMAKISAKLLKKAEAAGGGSGGSVKIGSEFSRRAAETENLKLQAPDMVKPTGTLSVEESLTKMAETRQILETLRPLFEQVEALEHKFPHPFFGALNAHEWLVLVGVHGARHLKQIRAVLEKNGAGKTL